MPWSMWDTMARSNGCPARPLALSGRCFPEALLGPLPVIYPFIVNNPGEAVQAKRRIAPSPSGI